MSVSVFNEKAFAPDDELVAAVLADAQPLWEELERHIREEYPDITKEWKYYGKASGWTAKLVSKKRNLLFFIPQHGYFRVRIVLGEKAAACTEITDLPDDVKETIRLAMVYAEGRSVDIDISRREQLEPVKTLLKIKSKN